MAIYEYECESCGIFEIQQSIKDPSLSICPNCRGIKIKRILSICRTHFQGNGWTPKFHTKNVQKKNSKK